MSKQTYYPKHYTGAKSNIITKSEEDEMEGVNGQVPMFNEQKTINNVDAYLDGPILSPAYYRPLVHYAQNMQEDDTLKLWINSPGGNVDGMMQIIDAMQNAEGQVIAIITGEAYSAGSIIALSAPNLIVSRNATMMCHAPSYGVGRMKFADVTSYVDFSRKQLHKIAQEAYVDFMTEAEISQMLDGKDFWFDYDEILRRLEIRAGLQKQRAESEAQQEQEVEKPKRIARKSRKVEQTGEI